ncbi:hypothetical protein [Paraglaciecola sp. 20A4]|uniref:hypothetical protein n=1 Tax=Paraglaciecola sp. 20A4 TaxID=2687288 RepID=UPI00140D48C2|nr:hypothetical protein [Paraglaciecola sp. 20A4]
MPLTFILSLLALFISTQAKSNSAPVTTRYMINVTEVDGEQPQVSTTRLFKYLYANLNISPTLVSFPSKRGLNMVNNGKLDAEAFRFASVGGQYKNLIRVIEPVGVGQTGFFCVQQAACKIDEAHKIAMLVGFVRATDICTNFSLNCKYVSSAKGLAKLLEQGLVHAILATTIEGKQIICQAKQSQYFFKLEESLVRYGYHYVHRKHQSLVPMLAQNIREMRQKGMLNFEKTLAQLTDYGCNKRVTIL